MLLGESRGYSQFIQYPDAYTESGLGSVQRRHASLSEDPITRETYLELVRRTLVNKSDIQNSAAARIAGFQGDVAEGTSVGRYVIRTGRITDGGGLNWTCVVAVSESSLFGTYRSAVTQATVIGLGFAVATSYLLFVLLWVVRKAEIKRVYEDGASAASISQDLTSSPSAEAISKEDLEKELSPDSQEFFDKWAKILKPHVLQANLAMRLHNKQTEPPVMASESIPMAAEKHRALQYIRLVYLRGLSLQYILSLQQSLDFKRLTGYRIFHSKIYQTMYDVSVGVFMCLAFAEAPASETAFHRSGSVDDSRDLLASVEIICLVIFCLDMLFELWLMGFRAGSKMPAPSSVVTKISRGNRQNSVRSKNEIAGSVSESVDPLEETPCDTFDDAPRDNLCCFDLCDRTAGDIDFYRGFRAFLLSVFVVDSACHLMLKYLTGPGTEASNDHIDKQVLLLPYTAILRPIWLFTRHQNVRATLHNFCLTLVRAANVFAMLLFVLVIGSIAGVLVLSGRMNDTDPTNYNKVRTISLIFGT